MVKVHEIVEDYEPVILHSPKTEKALIYKHREMNAIESVSLNENTLEILVMLCYAMINPDDCDCVEITLDILKTLFPDNTISVECDEEFYDYFVIE